MNVHAKQFEYETNLPGWSQAHDLIAGEECGDGSDRGGLRAACALRRFRSEWLRPTWHTHSCVESGSPQNLSNMFFMANVRQWRTAMHWSPPLADTSSEPPWSAQIACYFRIAMNVSSTHLEYDATLEKWQWARDVISGGDAVKGGAEKYLPRLNSQTDDEYAAYRMRASFFNATARTADGYVGMIFRRAPFQRLPSDKSTLGQALATFANDAEILGTSLYGYARNVVTEVIAVEYVLRVRLAVSGPRSHFCTKSGPPKNLSNYILPPFWGMVRNHGGMVRNHSAARLRRAGSRQIACYFRIAMNVSSTHFENVPTLAKWQRARDVIAGEDVVKAVGRNYLPRLHVPTDDEHTACGLRLSFCNAAARTVEGHLGMTSRHAPFQRLSELRKTGEGADAWKLGLPGENWVSARLATRVNGSPPQVLRWVRWWDSTEAIPDQVTEKQVLVELNSGANAKGIEAQGLTGVVNSWRAGAIRQGTMPHLLPDGEILPRRERQRRGGTPSPKNPASCAHESPTHSDHPMKQSCPLWNASRAVLGSFDAPGVGGRWDPLHLAEHWLHEHRDGQLGSTAISQRRIEI